MKVEMRQRENANPGRCPYCHEDIGLGSIYVCKSCHTAHHKECWDEYQGCSILGCLSVSKKELLYKKESQKTDCIEIAPNPRDYVPPDYYHWETYDDSGKDYPYGRCWPKDCPWWFHYPVLRYSLFMFCDYPRFDVSWVLRTRMRKIETATHVVTSIVGTLFVIAGAISLILILARLLWKKIPDIAWWTPILFTLIGLFLWLIRKKSKRDTWKEAFTEIFTLL